MPVATSTITAAWVPPPAILQFSGSVVEEESLVHLNWAASGQSSTDFHSYVIYRREMGDSGWDALIEITSQSVIEYDDFTAGQTIVYEYMILQYKKIPGDTPLASDESDIVTAGLEGDSWFLAGLFVGTYDAVELIVISEEHSAVVQQEVFEPLAGIRKRIVRGLHLGDEGQFTAVFDTSIARDSKEYFEALASTPGPHVLKSAFGDVWTVEFDAPAFKYQAGGHLEVTMGWVEI